MSSEQPRCENCRFWRRLTALAIVGRCKTEAAYGFTNERWTCSHFAAWRSPLLDEGLLREKTRRLLMALCVFGLHLGDFA
jgi:hypothetical protein